MATSIVISVCSKVYAARATRASDHKVLQYDTDQLRVWEWWAITTALPEQLLN